MRRAARAFFRWGAIAFAAAPLVCAAADDFAFYGQATNVTQGHPPFTSPYEGANSLLAHGRTEETTDLTIYAGMRAWKGAEAWINPEIDQGFGLSNTLGLAGFSSGEAYKVGSNAPYIRLPRAFLRQVIALGAEEEEVEPGPNQLGGKQPTDNVTLTIGKFSAVDIFDANAYAHDPRGDFMNWSIVDAGAFDYAADPWGFTYGAAAEWTRAAWTLRGGIFQMSPVPNSKITNADLRQYMLAGEVERRYQLDGHPGKVKLLAFANRAKMARYQDAVDLARLTGDVPDASLVRREAWRPGVVVNLEQELSADVGVFARASANNGDYEAYEFTEINKSLSGGVAIKGARWGRKDDTLGVAAAVNALSGPARAYFSAGGLGILIGDGALDYKPEIIFETYYALRVNRHLALGVDYQRVTHPAHNADRGPVDLFAFRAHVEF